MHFQFAFDLLDWFTGHVGSERANVSRNKIMNLFGHSLRWLSAFPSGL
jgi:hypothetical protein